jgi:hypothetical protein
MFRKIADDLWIHDADVPLPMGFSIPGRMTIVRRGDGSLTVHSPLPIDPGTARAIDALGEVRALVAPNCLHHLFLKPAAERYPKARVFAAPGLEKKVSGLDLAPLPASGPLDSLDDGLVVRRIDGAPTVTEHVLLHRASRSLVVTDLVFNLHRTASSGMRAVLWLGRAWKRPAQSLSWRFFVKDRAAATRSLADVLDWPFDRIIPAHGDVIERDARETLRRLTAWMSPNPTPLAGAGQRIV